MRVSNLVLVMVASAAAGGCSAVGVSPDRLISTLTLAGNSLIGNFSAPCTTVANYNNASSTTAVGTTAGSASNLVVEGSSSAQVPAFTFSADLVITGHVTTGTYISGSTSGFTGTIVITNAGAATWRAASGTENQTFTLRITKVTTLTTTANGTAYLIDGSLDATVPPVSGSGATGTVTVHADFTNNN